MVKFVLENYWGINILNTALLTETLIGIGLAGKTLTVLMVGIAQEDGLLSIEDSSAIILAMGGPV